MNQRVLLGAATWLAVAATATGAGIAAIGVLEDGITGSRPRPLDRGSVQQALSQSGATVEAVPTPSPTPSPTAGEGITRVLGTGGGTVTARCAAGQVALVSWTPAQGFRADDSVRGPANVASLKFKSDAQEYEVTVVCDGNEPKVRTSKDDGHHGRGRGG